MDTQTTRGGEFSQTGSSLYLAFELGRSSWRLAFTVGAGQKPRQRGIAAGDLAKLAGEIELAKRRFALPPEARVVSCYEAGRDGFWLHRWLEAEGVKNLVVDSSSIEVKRRGRRMKTDRLDVEKLLAMLLRYEGGEKKVWSVVNAPTVEEEEGRQLHREAEELKREKTRLGNRMKGLMASQGLSVKVKRGFLKYLREARLWDGSQVPALLQARLEREWARLEEVKKQLGEVEKQRREAVMAGDSAEAEKMRSLMQLRGLGLHLSTVLVREFFGWRRFKNRRQVGALAGLVPTLHQSGDLHHGGGISKAGNARVRKAAVEMAWLWVRWQSKSRLSLWFEERFGSGGGRLRRIGIVAVARRLLVDLWRYLDHGVIPEGAVVKA
jgi:transposase